MLRDRESERCFPNFLCCALLIRKLVIHWQMELVRGPWEGVLWGVGVSWESFVIRFCSRNGFVYSAVRGRLMHRGLCVCNCWSFAVLSRQTTEVVVSWELLLQSVLWPPLFHCSTAVPCSHSCVFPLCQSEDLWWHKCLTNEDYSHFHVIIAGWIITNNVPSAVKVLMWATIICGHPSPPPCIVWEPLCWLAEIYMSQRRKIHFWDDVYIIIGFNTVHLLIPCSNGKVNIVLWACLEIERAWLWEIGGKGRLRGGRYAY